MKQPDITELIIATDAGREGELVARWIMAKAGWRKNVKRLWISSRLIKPSWKASKISGRVALMRSVCFRAMRAEADWLIGLNVTRALTCKYAAQLSAGRVQTPTLYMVVEREKEIQNFTPRSIGQSI
jgi:DNA topoisomerase-3